MSEDVIKKYIKFLEEIEENLKKLNFRACRAINADLIRLSWYFDFQEGIFLGECVDSMLSNLEDLDDKYELDKKDVAKVVEKISDLLKTIRNALPEVEKNIIKLYKSMRDARVLVTNLQFKYWRYETRKLFRPRIRLRPG